MTRPASWALRQEQERAPVKAARLAALLYIRSEGLLLDASKTEIAEALDVSRWTLDRDIATLDYVAENYERFRLALLRLPRQQPPDQAGAVAWLADYLANHPQLTGEQIRTLRILHRAPKVQPMTIGDLTGVLRATVNLGTYTRKPIRQIGAVRAEWVLSILPR